MSIVIVLFLDFVVIDRDSYFDESEGVGVRRSVYDCRITVIAYTTLVSRTESPL